MSRSILKTGAFLFGLLGLALATACGSDGQGSTGGGASGGASAGGAGGSGGSAGGGAGTATCNPACTPPQICSKAGGGCIDAGSCAGDADCDAGMVCDMATKKCVPGGGCGAEEVVADAIPPNILLVVDRSCSMTEVVANNQTKWAIAVAAMNKMTVDYNSKIRFGLTLFPDLVTPNCQQDAIPIPVAPGNEMAIQTLLTKALVKADPYFPDGPCVTNIETGIKQAGTEPAFNDTTRDSYVILITDGKETCGSDANTEAFIQMLHDTRMISTFVIGFGAGVDPAQMDKFAVAGGVPAMGAHQYYDASDQASLDLALSTIAQKTISCNYTLASVPPNPDEIFVFFDNVTSVPRDATMMNGWQYDAAKNQIVFYGQACDDLKNGIVKDLDIVLGCDQPTPN